MSAVSISGSQSTLQSFTKVVIRHCSGHRLPKMSVFNTTELSMDGTGACDGSYYFVNSIGCGGDCVKVLQDKHGEHQGLWN